MSLGALVCGAALAAAPPAAPAAPAKSAPVAPAKPTLEETRLTLSKWIETQQIISKERNDWQQARDVLLGRVDLVGKEVAALKERIAQSESAIAEAGKKRDELLQEKSKLIVVTDQLRTAVVAMEGRLRELAKQLPEPVAAKVQPLMQRIPTDPGDTRVTVAERYQNVLGILNELNKANSEITVAYEIRTLADGVSSEVQVVYVGLAQAYFLSPSGEAGIGRPSPEGWKWEPAPNAAEAIAMTLEIIQGKRTPSFVPLPVTIQ
ncbi:MAG: DUF3450 family protein [Phycisphaerales bacterium]